MLKNVAKRMKREIEVFINKILSNVVRVEDSAIADPWGWATNRKVTDSH